MRQWFSENVQKTKQVRGAKSSYVAQRAFQEFQADIFYITPKQMPNQQYPFGLSMIDVFSKYATVIPLKERKAPDIMAAISKGFKEIGKQPEGALHRRRGRTDAERRGARI